ncbi:hypothetical protein ACWEPZ_31535 [Streptomyces sp. NPDC004288]
MAHVKVSTTDLTVEFSRYEGLWLRRDALTVPLAAVLRAVPVDAPLQAAYGTRKGIEISGFTKIGVWGLVKGPRRLVVAYRNRPGLLLTLDRAVTGQEYDELVLSLDEAREVCRLIEQRRGND